MCLAVPLKIIEISGKEAVGEINGLRKKIRVDLLPNIEIEDYVMVHAGFAIEKIDKKYAEEATEAVLEVNEVARQLRIEARKGKR